MTAQIPTVSYDLDGIDPFEIITKKQLKRYVPYSGVHIDRLEAKGEFPKRLIIGKNRVGWFKIEVIKWCLARITERKK